MQKRALVIGINDYQNVTNLGGCVDDAIAISELLSKHENGSPNYEVRTLTTPSVTGGQPVTRAVLREAWERLISNFDGHVLFYFAGHGGIDQTGASLTTHDATQYEPGVHMNELLMMANKSQAKEKVIILDCCFGGSFGNPENLQGADNQQAQLAEGVTILSASKHNQTSAEIPGGHGVFTNLLIGGLSDGAKDVRGMVSAASLYSYTEQALGAWDQRPMYKSHLERMSPLRLCKPRVKDENLRKLKEVFKGRDTKLMLDRSFEPEEKKHFKAEHGEILYLLREYRDAGLLMIDAEHLYDACMTSKEVSLTELGKFYWDLASQGRI